MKSIMLILVSIVFLTGCQRDIVGWSSKGTKNYDHDNHSGYRMYRYIVKVEAVYKNGNPCMGVVVIPKESEYFIADSFGISHLWVIEKFIDPPPDTITHELSILKDIHEVLIWRGEIKMQKWKRGELPPPDDNSPEWPEPIRIIIPDNIQIIIPK